VEQLLAELFHVAVEAVLLEIESAGSRCGIGALFDGAVLDELPEAALELLRLGADDRGDDRATRRSTS
jgi:hypothetical protein